MRFVRFFFVASVVCLAPLPALAESKSNATPQPTVQFQSSILAAHGFAIDYFSLAQQHAGIDDGIYKADVAITPVSMPNVDLPKFEFQVENVSSILDMKEKLKPMIAKAANTWIEDLQKERAGWEKNGYALSPLPAIKPAAPTDPSRRFGFPSRGFSMKGFDLYPQHRGYDDGTYGAYVTVVPVSRPDFNQFFFKVEDVKTIDDVKDQIKSKLIHRLDSWIHNMQEDEKAFEQNGRALSPLPIIR